MCAAGRLNFRYIIVNKGHGKQENHVMKAQSICTALILATALAMAGITHAAQIVAAGNSQCMTVPEHGGMVPDGTMVRSIECRGQNNQQWSVSNGVISGFAGVCLDIQGSSSADGTQVIGVACNGAPSQQWVLTNGQIIGMGGKCLAVPPGSRFRAPLVISACSNAPGQQWSVS
jgi:Ricin-type beta-trefoil lectin domain